MDGAIDKNKSKVGIKLVLNYLFFHYAFFQLISILRATAYYNTAYLANYSNIFISLSVIMLFIVDLKNIRFKFIEVFLIFFPLLNSLLGIVINGINRNTFSHLFTSTFFVILLVYIRNRDFKFTKKLQIKFANWIFWGLMISIFSYRLAPLIGVKVHTVGVVSIFSLFPLIVFFNNRNRVKFLITIVLIVLGGKRGVLLSGIVAFVGVGLGQKTIKKSTRTIILLCALFIVFGIFYASATPERISHLPNAIKPMMFRMMYTNPFSEFNRISYDPRVREIKGALKPLIEQPLSFITGRGGGFSYEYLDVDGNYEKTLHNTHFSPVAILARYGILYMLILYFFIIKTIYKNFKMMKRNELAFEMKVLLIYSIASFINSFTAFTIYLDYLFIISLGLLSTNTRNYTMVNKLIREKE